MHESLQIQFNFLCIILQQQFTNVFRGLERANFSKF